MWMLPVQMSEPASRRTSLRCRSIATAKEFRPSFVLRSRNHDYVLGRLMHPALPHWAISKDEQVAAKLQTPGKDFGH